MAKPPKTHSSTTRAMRSSSLDKLSKTSFNATAAMPPKERGKAQSEPDGGAAHAGTSVRNTGASRAS